LLFGDDKRQLWAWKRALVERLAGLRLTIHEQCAQVRPVREGVPFLGFVVYPHKRRLKRRKGVAFGRKFRALARDYSAGCITREQLEASVRGWVNHVRYGDTEGLRRDILTSVRIDPRPPAPSKKGTLDGDHAALYQDV
jgi:hypothetical protein